MAARSPPPSTVATSFVAHYYRVLSKKPAELFRFYKEESSFTFGAPGEAAEPVTGIEAIKTKITGLGLEGAKVEVGQGSVDAQASRDGGVVMLVTGTIALATGQQPAQAFAQTFFLAPQVVVQQGRTAPVPSYFVLNDTLRFVQPAAAAAAAAALGRSPEPRIVPPQLAQVLPQTVAHDQRPGRRRRCTRPLPHGGEGLAEEGREGRGQGGLGLGPAGPGGGGGGGLPGGEQRQKVHHEDGLPPGAPLPDCELQQSYWVWACFVREVWLRLRVHAN